ncbi:MAG: hypothetical protein J0I84_15600 [Terrimonas sp.]|nr:hypothetical protein [Terrimonas sp.]OJY87737.1 MAG: hypothetical protein BGP13_04715 [Sphingobacteriales bacterium 40-81]
MKRIIVFAILILCNLPRAHSFLSDWPKDNKTDTTPHELLYDLPAFTPGTIFLKNGTTGTHLFNYNCFREEMQLLSGAGDTLKLIEPELMDSLVIGDRVYFYDKVYLLLISRNNGYKIAIRKTIQSRAIEYIGTLNETDYFPVIGYFIGNRFNHFRIADKDGFLKIFSEKRDGLREYIKANNIDFKKEEDIRKLFKYCST